MSNSRLRAVFLIVKGSRLTFNNQEQNQLQSSKQIIFLGACYG